MTAKQKPKVPLIPKNPLPPGPALARAASLVVWDVDHCAPLYEFSAHVALLRTAIEKYNDKRALRDRFRAVRRAVNDHAARRRP